MQRSARAVLVLALSIASAALAGSDVPPEAVVAELPFLASDEVNRIYLDLAPEGSEPFRLMLDTGASFSVLTPLAARAAGVSVRAIKDTPYRRATRLGHDLQFYVDTRSSDTGSSTGWEYGLLGANFLENYVVELDFAKRSVRFLDPDRFAVPERVEAADESVLPLESTSSRPILTVRVDGHPIDVLFDTGAPMTAVLSGPTAKSVGIDVDALQPFGTLETALGSTQTRLYEAREIEIAGQRIARVPVEVSPKGWFNQVGSSSSVIGYDLISQFLVRIDYKRKRIWLRRQSETVTYLGVDYAMTRETGAFLSAAGKNTIVVAVLPGTPAARLGLRSGDAVLREDTKDAHRLSLEEVLAAIRAGKPVRIARLVNDVWLDIDLPDDPVLQPNGDPKDE